MPTLQRRPRRAIEDDEEEEQRPRHRQRLEDPRPQSQDESEDQADDDVQGEDSAHSQLVKKLVRYALACEYSRTPIRRDGIRDKVLGNQGRSFKRVFEGAQMQFRAVFGMEMVEWPARDKLTKEEKRKAAKSHIKGGQSKAYMLVTTLPESYRNSAILAPSRVQSADDEAAYVAFYTVVIALITLNGGELSDPKMKRYLRRLNADTNAWNANKTEDVLARLQRQGYIVKNVDREARLNGEDEATTWYVGPRGKVECGAENLASVIREVCGGSTEELESRLQTSLRVKERAPAKEHDEKEEGATEQRNGENSVRQNGLSGRRRSARAQATQRRETEAEVGEDEGDERLESEVDGDGDGDGDGDEDEDEDEDE